VVGLQKDGLRVPAGGCRAVGEVAEQFDGGAAEAVQALVIVAHDGEGAAAGASQFHVDLFLQQVGVLVFVDEHGADLSEEVR